MPILGQVEDFVKAPHKPKAKLKAKEVAEQAVIRETLYEVNTLKVKFSSVTIWLLICRFLRGCKAMEIRYLEFKRAVHAVIKCNHVLCLSR